MTKVCHLTSVHPRFDSRIFWKECKSLKKQGYDVSIIVADDIGDEVKDNIKIFDVKRDDSRLNRMIKAPLRVYKKAIEIDADIYHFHDPELIKTGLKLIKKGKKVIYDTHEDVPRQILSKPYLNRFSKNIVSNIFERFENKHAAKFSYIITATDFIKDRFLKVNKNVNSIKNYPILEELNISTSWERKQNKACYIGSLSEVRGIKEVIEAMQFAHFDLNLAGTFSTKEFQTTVQNLNSWNKVSFHGFANREQVKIILSESKVGLVTLYPTINYIDALPVKMFEYMSAGLPVICSNIDLWNDIIESNNCGICVDPKNPKEIAEAGNKIIKNDKLAAQMGKNGRLAVEKKYNWKLEEEKLIKVYAKLIND